MPEQVHPPPPPPYKPLPTVADLDDAESRAASPAMPAAADNDHEPLLEHSNDADIDSDNETDVAVPIDDGTDDLESASKRGQYRALHDQQQSKGRRSCKPRSGKHDACLRGCCLSALALLIVCATLTTVTIVTVRPASLAALAQAKRQLVIDRTDLTGFRDSDGLPLSDVFARIVLSMDEKQSGTWKRVCSWFDNKVTVNDADYDLYVKEVSAEDQRRIIERRRKMLKELGLDDSKDADVLVERPGKDGRVVVEVQHVSLTDVNDEDNGDDDVDEILSTWNPSKREPHRRNRHNRHRRNRRRHDGHNHHESPSSSLADMAVADAKASDDHDRKLQTLTDMIIADAERTDEAERRAQEEYRKSLSQEMAMDKSRLNDLFIHDTEDMARKKKPSKRPTDPTDPASGYKRIGRVSIPAFRPTLDKDAGEIGVVNRDTVMTIEDREYVNDLGRRISDLGEHAPRLHVKILGKPTVTVWGWFKTWGQKVDMDLHLSPAVIFQNVGKYNFAVPDSKILPPRDPLSPAIGTFAALKGQPRATNVSDLYYTITANATFDNPFPITLALNKTQFVIPVYYLSSEFVHQRQAANASLCPEAADTLPPLTTVYFPANRTDTADSPLPDINIQQGPGRLAIDMTVPVDKLPDIVSAARRYQAGKTIYVRVGPGIKATVQGRTDSPSDIATAAEHACIAHAITKPDPSDTATIAATSDQQAIQELTDEMAYMLWFKGFVTP
ncbi:hypothetical protein RI367_000079 [Sorochytrium milnesiophthora]